MFKIKQTDERRFDVLWNDEVVGTFSSRKFAELAIARYSREGGAR